MLYGGRLPVPSQDPYIAPVSQRNYAQQNYLPVLVKMWMIIEAETNYRWHATSYWRDSPSHHIGCSLDIAPDIADNSKKYYGVYVKSDPVMYKRTALIRDLQRAVHKFRDDSWSIGVYIESDHLHMQVYRWEDAKGRARLFKWALPKPTYPDTYERIKLPMLP